jgi:hypothetical protein
MRRPLLLILLLAPLLVAWFGPRGCSERPKVLLLGLDGADWDVMDPLIEAGYLPNLGRVVKSGARAGLSCYEALPALACFCPPVWNSIATGVSFDAHRVVDLFEPSWFRQRKAIWSVLRDYGGTSTGMALRNTWPFEPDMDFLLTEPGLDYASFQIYERWNDPPHGYTLLHQYHTFPVGLFQTLGMLPHVGPRPPVWSMPARDRVTMEALRRLVDVAQTDLTFVVLHSPDKIEHVLWGVIQAAPNAPVDPAPILASAAAYSGPVEGPSPYAWGTLSSSYQEIDAWLGRLLRHVHYDYIVLTSDHGMARNPDDGLAGTHGTNVPESHIGIFAMSGPGVRRRDLGVVSIFDVAPTVAHLLELPVGADLPGRVLEEAFWRSWLRRRPVSTVASWELPPPEGWLPPWRRPREERPHPRDDRSAHERR